jgi:hypothetical protein
MAFAARLLRKSLCGRGWQPEPAPSGFLVSNVEHLILNTLAQLLLRLVNAHGHCL